MTKSLEEALDLAPKQEKEDYSFDSHDFGAMDHEKSMDVIHEESLRSARELYDLGHNIDHARSRGIFEQAANFMKIALDAKNAKRDAQLKSAKLKIDIEKLALEKGQGEIPMEGSLIVEDRNALLKQIMEADKKPAPEANQ